MSIGGTDTIAIWETGDTFSDEDIAHLAAYSDTASASAMASACAEAVFEINIQELLAFWNWWVNSALTEAWSKVTLET